MHYCVPGQFDILGETKKCDLFLLGHLSFLKQDFICSISNFTIFEVHIRKIWEKMLVR